VSSSFLSHPLFSELHASPFPATDRLLKLILFLSSTALLPHSNDIFVVELANGQDRKSRKALRSLRSHFRLRHHLTGCYLFSHKVKLPEWGFEQQEVTCNKNPTIDNALWYIETNEHPRREFFVLSSFLFVQACAFAAFDRAQPSLLTPSSFPLSSLFVRVQFPRPPRR